MDTKIRFAGIASLDGKILAAEYRQDIIIQKPLLTLQESELSMMQSLMRMSIRRTLEGKLGRTVYATAVYEKVKRATIPLFNEEEKNDSYLMVSFEREANHEAIINEKILPFLEKIGKGLAN
ncbi:MAG: hypothetical protein QXX64_05260 [Nitrososphaera sp.]|uniref:Uncharacterized protein n=1 Tax=Nitrososphaera gargensis (strain Ga9.2) TaxID=1237085 RepID=K0II97_NITGG|nr:hypothetical protein [Candidatus Nitrososphaera gargensis]AFU57712.1 hypothetical protein Ngar_c07700 [Candidatus Nitrososphaera gargensis Ga9.2]